ncbi:Ig-like domain-containing protein [Streptomyces sp. NPDC059175]|uniref:L,D-transpeptidase n=1 Tax=unclassified Streptomyces TaxID=2593676 RepID=UPI0036A91F53
MSNVVRRTRATVAVALLWTGLLTGLAGCSGGGTDIPDRAGASRDADDGAKAPSPVDTLRITPQDGAKGVSADEKLEVSLAGGHLERVTVTRIEDAQPQQVPGAISADGLHWRPAAGTRLALAAKYSVDAVALDALGRRAARRTTFTTVVPEHRFIGYFKPENRSTVGTGMIVSFVFNRGIQNRAAVQRAVRITSEPPVEVVGHWFDGQRLDFRPQEYWKPGTRVTVDAQLRDVEGAPGVFGIQSQKVTFTVGREQISLVDARKHTMEVRREGALLATLPVTTGARKTTTYNGKMVISEMLDVTRMNGATVGFKTDQGKSEYDIKDVPHAMRLTTSGTFLHGNYWVDPAIFGRANVSHGCIGLRDEKGGSEDAPAGWFFDRSLIGDVVEVVNSRDRQVDPWNGLSGWNMDWKEWKAGSAVG